MVQIPILRLLIGVFDCSAAPAGLSCAAVLDRSLGDPEVCVVQSGVRIAEEREDISRNRKIFVISFPVSNVSRQCCWSGNHIVALLMSVVTLFPYMYLSLRFINADDTISTFVYVLSHSHALPSSKKSILCLSASSLSQTYTYISLSLFGCSLSPLVSLHDAHTSRRQHQVG